MSSQVLENAALESRMLGNGPVRFGEGRSKKGRNQYLVGRLLYHKLSTRLIRENQVVCVESLAVKNMVKNGKLSKAISDVGWSEFVAQLDYKADWYGRTLVKIDKWYPSSKRCFDCGHVLDSLPLDIRQWDCPECGASHDRDVNAAKNIVAAGLAVLACGEAVRPGRVSSRAGKLQRSRKP